MALDNDYEIVGHLGEGAFGKVYKARHKTSGDMMAVKQIKLGSKSWDEALKSPELQAMSSKAMRHPFIVRLRELLRSQSDGSLYYIFEFIGSDLCRLVSRHPQGVEEGHARDLSRQMFAGLAHIHQCNFFHRDVKPENILYDEDTDTVRIADFGAARSLRARPPFTDYVGTRWYRAPECLLRDLMYSSPVDVWAAGLVFAELLRGSPVFCGTSGMDQLYKIFNVVGTPHASDWPDFTKLADACRLRTQQDSTPWGLDRMVAHGSPQAQAFLVDVLKLNPRRRPPAKKCLEHPFFGRCPPLDLRAASNSGMDEGPDTCRSGASAAMSTATGATAAASDDSALAESLVAFPTAEPHILLSQVAQEASVRSMPTQGDLDIDLDIDAELDQILGVGSRSRRRSPSPELVAVPKPVAHEPSLQRLSSVDDLLDDLCADLGVEPTESEAGPQDFESEVVAPELHGTAEACCRSVPCHCLPSDGGHAIHGLGPSRPPPTGDGDVFHMLPDSNSACEFFNQIIGLFHRFDTNRDGHISYDELRELLQIIGVPPSDIGKVFDAVDSSRDGKVDWDEFVAWIHSESSPVQEKLVGSGAVVTYALQKIHSVLVAQNCPLEDLFRSETQPNNPHYLLKADVFRMMLRYDATLTQSTLEQAYTAFDADGNGGVDLSEFLQAFAIRTINAPSAAADTIAAETMRVLEN